MNGRRFWIALMIALLIGLALRAGLVVASGWRIDYDEAMVGLTALRVMRGEHSAYLPAQASLGAGEAYLLAPLFAIFGANVAVFRAYSLACAGALIALTGLIGRAAFGTRVGALAALLAAVAPPYTLVVTLKTWGATVETMLLGGAVLLAVHYAVTAESPRARRGWMALAGGAAGASFWMAWLGFYYLIPAGLVMLWRGRANLRDWRALVVAGMAFAVTSAPFWTFNAANDWPTITQVVNDNRMTPDEIAAVGDHFVRALLPQLVTGEARWGGVGGLWTRVLLGAHVLGVAALIWLTLRERARGTMRAMLALLVVVVPLIYVSSTQSRNALNPFGIDATGRYIVMLHSALPVGLAALIALPRLGRPCLGGLSPALVIVGVVVALNLAGSAQLDPRRAFDSPYYDRLPASLDGLIAVLDAEGVRHVWTDVGVGQVLMFVTQERILAADWYDASIAGGPVRFPEVLAAVEAAPYVAYLVPIRAGQTDMPLERAFRAAGVGYRARVIDETLLLILPDSPTPPERVAAGLGYQY
jgi:hypothetical protein